MPSWSNWSGRLQARPERLHFARSEEDVAAVVREAAGAGLTVRAAGAGHSHSPLVPNDGVIIDLSGLAGIVGSDRENRTACVRAGTPIYELGAPLHEAGLALVNQGDIDRQSIGGACATGTHGTGATLGNLSTAVVGARVVLASGEVMDCSARQQPDVWRAARLNLGALGIITRLTLQLREAYCLAERSWTEPLDDLMPRVPGLITRSRHFEFFWYPDTDRAVAKVIDETDEGPLYPLAREGARRAWSYEVLPNHRPHRHTEMEYSVPAEAGERCLADIRTLIRTEFAQLRWPVEYRTLAADDVWLSPAHGRATVTISVHEDVREDESPYFRACEEIFLTYGGRPHWGKMHYLDGERLARLHPAWSEWWTVRDAVDPRGVFLNDHLRALRPGADSAGS